MRLSAARADASRSFGRRVRRSLRLHVPDLLGAAGGSWFAYTNVEFFVSTHRLIGIVFFVQQSLFALAFLTRRQPRTVSRRPLEWVVTLGGSFGGFLLRPPGLHPAWGVEAGLTLQLIGVGVWAFAFVALWGSFGMLPADRGLVTSGPYLVVRHPLYASYMLTQVGYLMQSVSIWNVLVIATTWTCNLVRIPMEERLLLRTASYENYRRRVRWRLVPAVW